MSLFGPYWFQDSSIPPNIENDSNGVQLSSRFNIYFDHLSPRPEANQFSSILILSI
ncbi:hypothetical protein C8J55DRAFT_561507 [Lentinula edodes]|uniref:Uncharacterized protein n=1 Tax=Lentinula lateritia TaxID=40482 RepID=A0A9W9DM12_9AGAR|nr:hypothetical protein C8J55DRAFT_561507 [Lentinula edodes]